MGRQEGGALGSDGVGACMHRADDDDALHKGCIHQIHVKVELLILIRALNACLLARPSFDGELRTFHQTIWTTIEKRCSIKIRFRV